MEKLYDPDATRSHLEPAVPRHNGNYPDFAEALAPGTVRPGRRRKLRYPKKRSDRPPRRRRALCA